MSVPAPTNVALTFASSVSSVGSTSTQSAESHQYNIGIEQLHQELSKSPPTRTLAEARRNEARNICDLTSVGSYRLAKLIEVLLVVINPIEKAAVLAHLKPIPKTTFEPQADEMASDFNGDWNQVRYVAEPPLDHYLLPPRAWIGVYGFYVTAVVQCGEQGSMGRFGASNTLIPAIAGFLPRVVINVGVMYGAAEEPNKPTGQRFGDVIVATHICGPEWHSVRAMEDGTEIVELRSESKAVGAKIQLKFTNSKAEFEDKHFNPAYTGDGQCVRVHAGHIASASVLMDNAAKKAALFKLYQKRGITLLGGEMEGMGLYLAGEQNSLSEWIVVKGISDWGDGTKDKVWQPFAAEMAAQYTELVLSKKEFFENWHAKLAPKTEAARNLLNNLQKAVTEQERLSKVHAQSASTHVASQLPPKASANQIFNALMYLVKRSTSESGLLEECPRCGNNSFKRHAGLRVLTGALTNDFGECHICGYNPGHEFREHMKAAGQLMPQLSEEITADQLQEFKDAVPLLRDQPEFKKLSPGMKAALEIFLALLPSSLDVATTADSSTSNLSLQSSSASSSTSAGSPIRFPVTIPFKDVAENLESQITTAIAASDPFQNNSIGEHNFGVVGNEKILNTKLAIAGKPTIALREGAPGTVVYTVPIHVVGDHHILQGGGIHWQGLASKVVPPTFQSTGKNVIAATAILVVNLNLSINGVGGPPSGIGLCVQAVATVEDFQTHINFPLGPIGEAIAKPILNNFVKNFKLELSKEVNASNMIPTIGAGNITACTFTTTTDNMHFVIELCPQR